jgi:hypothetical protein
MRRHAQAATAAVLLVVALSLYGVTATVYSATAVAAQGATSGVTAGAAAQSGGSDEPAATVTSLRPAPGGLNSPLGPRPGEELAPESKDDRGGWLQLALLAAIVAGLGGIGTLIWRDVQRSRARAEQLRR